MSNTVLFPLQALHHFDKRRSCIHDERHAEFELESFDSDSPDDSKEITVVDSLGRRVRIYIDDRLIFQRVELASEQPVQEDIDRISEYRYVPPRAGWPFETRIGCWPFKRG